MGLLSRVAGALSQARGAVASAARTIATAPAEAARGAATAALGRAEAALQAAARAAGLGRAAEPTRAAERAATAARPSHPTPPAAPARAETTGGGGGGLAAAPGGKSGDQVFTIGGGAVTSGSNDKALMDYAVAAAAFADKLNRSTLNGAIPHAIAVDAKGREVAIPPEVYMAGPDAVADYLGEKIRQGKIGERVNIKAKKFEVSEGYDYEPPDDAGDHYTESVTPGAR